MEKEQYFPEESRIGLFYNNCIKDIADSVEFITEHGYDFIMTQFFQGMITISYD